MNKSQPDPVTLTRQCCREEDGDDDDDDDDDDDGEALGVEEEEGGAGATKEMASSPRCVVLKRTRKVPCALPQSMPSAS